MNVRLTKEIDKLKKNILSLGAQVEEQLHMAIKALVSLDTDVSKKVIEKDAEIDRLEVELEEDCLKILALHQPVAIDLRFIIAVLKINNDLERIGDLTTNIAQRTIECAKKSKTEIPFDFPTMAEKVKLMVRNSLDSLVNLNAETAKEVCGADNEVDAMHRKMYNQFEKAVKANPNKVESLTLMLGVSRFLERIADHATNIAEDVIYTIEGDIVRHGKLAE